MREPNQRRSFPGITFPLADLLSIHPQDLTAGQATLTPRHLEAIPVAVSSRHQSDRATDSSFHQRGPFACRARAHVRAIPLCSTNLWDNHCFALSMFRDYEVFLSLSKFIFNQESCPAAQLGAPDKGCPNLVAVSSVEPGTVGTCAVGLCEWACANEYSVNNLAFNDCTTYTC
jgi:hypothetical protein